MMGSKVRVIDSGLRAGRENIALDLAMVEARQAGDIPDSFRFIHFKPCALVGRHQDLAQELNLDACKTRDVQTVRRVTGGGAIYMDEGQLGWSLVCDRGIFGTPSLTEITEKICKAAAAGLSLLGIKAAFRPRNDIEIGGKKISGTGGYFDDNILMFQGTIIIDSNTDNMRAVLNVPAHKLTKHDADGVEGRVTSLAAELADVPSMEQIQDALLSGFRSELGFDLEWGKLTTTEEKLASRHHEEEIGTDEFVAEISDPARASDIMCGTNKAGNLKAYVRVEGNLNNRVREVLFVGDIFITPPRALMDLEAFLRGALLDDIEVRTQEYFDDADIGLLSVQPSEFSDAILAAIKETA
ncbi:Lipoate-protein ligase A [hydrothermal vent metagenome]|uniref:Lipoate-protein ligase A n=1 Tax=hydrothermal vent metagenome TaxID=652676 RepID=A0A3B0R9P4_9ZZZZ